MIFRFQTLFIFQKEMTFFWIYYACNFWRYFRHLIYKTYGSILPTDENIWPHQIWENFVQKVWGIMLRLQNKFKSSSFLNDVYFNDIFLYLCIYIFVYIQIYSASTELKFVCLSWCKFASPLERGLNFISDEMKVILLDMYVTLWWSKQRYISFLHTQQQAHKRMFYSNA